MFDALIKMGIDPCKMGRESNVNNSMIFSRWHRRSGMTGSHVTEDFIDWEFLFF
jgi:hypothetical protein